MRTYHINEVFYSLQGEGGRAGTANVFVRFAGCNLECDDRPGNRPGTVMGGYGVPVDAKAHGRACPQHGVAWDVTCEPCHLAQHLGLREQSHQAGFLCDTEFVSGRRMSAGQLLEVCENLDPHECRNVIFTGGEPALQVDDGLLDAFKGWHTSMETNGTRPVSDRIDWLTVSPKTAEHTLKVGRAAQELKYVRRAGQALPVPTLTYTADPDKHGFGPGGLFISVATQPDGYILKADLAWCVRLVTDHPEWRLTTQAHKGWAIR